MGSVRLNVLGATLVLACGCGRGRFEEVPDATCVLGAFSAPERLPGPVNSGNDEWAPALSADSLTLYLYTLRASALGPPDLWISTRVAVDGEFSAPTLLDGLSSAGRDTFPRPTADELALYFTSDVTGDEELYVATRPDRAAAFGPPLLVAELNSPLSERSPAVSPDGLEIVFSSNRGTGNDLYTARRNAPDEAFSSPQLVDAVNTLDAETTPAISADGLELFFISSRAGGVGGTDVWRATRPARDQPFGPPENLASINSPGDEYAPFVSADGTRLFLSYNASIGGGENADVWVATRDCE